MALLTISPDLDKMGGIHCCCLPAGITCPSGLPCNDCKFCYAQKGRFKFDTVQQCYLRNLDCWLHSPRLYEEIIVEDCLTQLFFRWHGSGDIPDPDYLEMMMRVAERCPRTNFVCMSKNDKVINDYLKSTGGFLVPNLNILLSHWGTMFIPDNPYDLPTAHVRFKKKALQGENVTIPKNAFQCGCKGKCNKCQFCWHAKRGQSMVMDEH